MERVANRAGRRWLRLAFWLSLAFAVTMALLPKPPELPTDRFGDKFQHIMAFAVLAGLAAAAYPQLARWRLVVRLALLGAAIELAQAIPALHRDSDWVDWVADTLAVIVVSGLLAVIVPRLRRSG